MISVAIVEDDAIFHTALSETIDGAPDMTLVGAAMTLAAGMDLLELDPPDVLVVDLGLPDGSGIDLIQAARFLWRRCEIMVSSVFGDETHVIAAIEAGATGYLLKDIAPPNLVAEIRSLHAGGSPISPIIARKLLSQLKSPQKNGDVAFAQKPPGGALSRREEMVLELIIRGYSHGEVAAEIGVSTQTVLTFVRRIYLKFGVRTRAEAIFAARRFGVGI